MRGLFKHLNLFSKRKQKRFWGDEKALVSFISPDLPAVTHLGQVIDINERGISFRYIAQDVRTQGVKELQLFGYRDDELKLDNVPCRIIYDIEVEKKILLSVPDIRRCGVQFLELSQHQRSLLEKFIARYALR